MKTAGEIVQEYLDRGYGAESLRILAESREEPLAGEMRAIIDSLEAPAATREASEILDAPCETGSFARVGDEVLFFVAGDDAAADGEGIDFDVMAETPLPEEDAAREESVADIVIGETAGADMVVTGAIFPVPAAETGIWRRIWSRAAPDPVAESVVESGAEEAIAVAELADEPAAAALESIAEIEVEAGAAAEAEEVSCASGDDGASAEISADYIPAFADMPVETRAISPTETPEEEGGAAAEVVVEEPAAEEASAPEAPEPEPAPESALELAPGLAPGLAQELAQEPAPAEDVASRKEKRRRERRERRKAARAQKTEETAEDTVEETVGDTAGETMPEAFVVAAEETGDACGLALCPPEAACLPGEADALREETPRPPMGEVMTILTPADLVPAAGLPAPGIAPDALAALSDASLALVSSLLAMSREELSTAAERLGQSRAPAEERENNIILFSEKFPLLAAIDAADGEQEEEREPLALLPFGEEEDRAFTPVLRVLPSPEAGDGETAAEGGLTETAAEAPADEPEVFFAEAAADDPADGREDILADMPAEMPVEEPAEESAEAREDVLAETPAEEPEAESEAAAADPQADIESLLEREGALRLRLEEEYQERLSDFAARLLEVQTAAAASESRAAERKAELDARTAVLEQTLAQLTQEEEKQRELLQKLDAADAAARAGEQELRDAAELRSEHARLYGEFEDLRKSYNEIVTDVLPALQQERDDLALTVERQCAKERKLRSSLGASRKRLAAGYVLGAAASLLLVALPLANWLRSPEEDKDLALDRQRLSELQETLDSQTRENVSAQARIVELERSMIRARDELARLGNQNRDRAGLADAGQKQHAQGIAVFAPKEGTGSGTPTRAMTMALQATSQGNGRLHVNEVMDPAGSIEQLALANREKNAPPARADAPRMAEGKAKAPLRVSAVARTEGGSLRPQAVAQAGQAARTARTEETASAATVTAKVKKGEGVAQVVYRVLNTRDPDVIAWVIQENGIRSDRRGNPVIQPNQELRLPRDGRTGQSASR